MIVIIQYLLNQLLTNVRSGVSGRRSRPCQAAFLAELQIPAKI